MHATDNSGSTTPMCISVWSRPSRRWSMTHPFSVFVQPILPPETSSMRLFIHFVNVVRYDHSRRRRDQMLPGLENIEFRSFMCKVRPRRAIFPFPAGSSVGSTEVGAALSTAQTSSAARSHEGGLSLGGELPGSTTPENPRRPGCAAMLSASLCFRSLNHNTPSSAWRQKHHCTSGKDLRLTRHRCCPVPRDIADGDKASTRQLIDVLCDVARRIAQAYSEGEGDRQSG